MTREQMIEALNMKMEQLISDIEYAVDNGDYEKVRRLGVQLVAVEQVYNKM